MKISNWRPSQRDGARLGSFDVTLPSGMMLCGCSLVNGEHGLFVGLPQREYMQGDTKKYAATVKIEDRDKRAKFDALVIQALREDGCIR
jgi:DNA-binding cell septation regulator SpoVG